MDPIPSTAENGSRAPLIASHSLDKTPHGEGSPSVSVENLNDSLQDSASIKELKARPKNERWSNRVEYILSLIGLAVGFGNIWRFPYYVQMNGGGAFLIPYFLMLLLLGIPAFYLEVHIGKVAQVGPLKAMHRLVPALGGTGLAAIITMIYITFYYNILIAYVLFYLFSSFQDPPAWSNAYCGNFSEAIIHNRTWYALRCNESAPTLFYYISVTGVSPDISDASGFSWKLLLCILGSWLLVFLCTFKGIKSIGKIAYVTTLLPYVILTVLLVRGATFEGAASGLEALFTPDLELLFNFKVWLQAGSQIFFSLSLGTGSNIVLSSHLNQKTTVLGDVIFVSIVNSATSLFAGIVVYMILGHNAFLNGGEVDNIMAGPGLVFIAFASALLETPPAPLWSILFFLMMLSLGLSSQFAGIQTLTETLRSIPYVSRLHETIVSFLLCLTFACCSVIYTIGNGQYILGLLDEFAGSYSFFIVIFFELVGVSWFFGVKKLLWFETGGIIITSSTKRFTRIRNNRYFKLFTLSFWFISWAVIAPFVILIIFTGSLIIQFVDTPNYTAFQNYSQVSVKYPSWSLAVIGLIILTTILPVPLGMAFEYRELWRMLKELYHQWRKLFSKFSWIVGLKSSKYAHADADDLVHYSVGEDGVFLVRNDKQD